MQNRLTRAFGIRYPLCSAGMAMIAAPPLVAAVSAAGGIGILGTGPAPTEWVRQAIRDVRRRTDRPFAVNLIHETTAFGPLCTDGHIDLCIEEAVDLVVFFWQLPPAAWVASLQEAGIAAWATVGDLATAECALSAGLHGLIVQGIEAGGHVRSAGALADLIGAVRRRAPDALLVAAGGIATAADVRRTLEIGADGVCLGTRFVASSEAEAHAEYQRRIIAAGPGDTLITDRFGPEWPGVPMRVLKNGASLGQAGPGPAGRSMLFGTPYEMPACSAVLPTRATVGDFDAMCLAAGESAAAIDAVAPAADIVRGLFDGWWTG